MSFDKRMKEKNNLNAYTCTSWLQHRKLMATGDPLTWWRHKRVALDTERSWKSRENLLSTKSHKLQLLSAPHTPPHTRRSTLSRLNQLFRCFRNYHRICAYLSEWMRKPAFSPLRGTFNRLLIEESTAQSLLCVLRYFVRKSHVDGVELGSLALGRESSYILFSPVSHTISSSVHTQPTHRAELCRHQ